MSVSTKLVTLGRKSLCQAVSGFVDAVGHSVDTAGEEVVKNNGQGRCSDTEGGIDQCFRDTRSQGCGVRSAGIGQRCERANHTQNGSQQSEQRRKPLKLCIKSKRVIG